MSVNNLYPTKRPSLDLNFAGSRTVDPRITFSRAGTGSIASYFGEKGVMLFAPPNTPRIDFDPVTGECKGLLIEEQRTNLLTYSEQFDNAAWTKGRISVAVNVFISPDGTLTADKLVEDTTVSNTHFITQTKNATSNTMTFSCYAKAAERTRFQLQAYEATTPASPVSALFDLSTGTVVSSTGNTTSAYMVPVGNGWYRCVATGTAALVSTTWNIRLASGSDAFYTGDGTSGLYIWGAQLEQGSFPTSYIPTTSAQVTRSTDVATMTGTNFSDWYRQDEGTFTTISSTIARTETDKRIISVNNGTTSNNIGLHYGGSSGGIFTSVIVASGIFQFGPQEGAYVAGEIASRALAYKADKPLVVTNGVAYSGASVVIPAGVDRLDIGHRTGIQQINGHIRRITYYPQRLSDQQLQALTT